MKLVTAIIKPDKLDVVREALTEIGLVGMTISEVRGYGRQGGHSEIYRGAEYDVVFVPKLRIDIAVSAAQTEAAVEAIRCAAHSGRIGDGKLFVTHLETAARIRTGESGEAAL